MLDAFVAELRAHCQVDCSCSQVDKNARRSIQVVLQAVQLKIRFTSVVGLRRVLYRCCRKIGCVFGGSRDYCGHVAGRV